ncbi:MAG: hypothetical protein IPJ71_11110 [Bdellovibrionales bacterium]|nr:hypothetical protein [Bdellovibrionales bacterium]
MNSLKQNVASRILSLRNQIEHHDYAYYVLDRPIISDYEYDKLFRELQQLEIDHPELLAPDSPTRRVGGTPAKQFVKRSHSNPCSAFKIPIPSTRLSPLTNELNPNSQSQTISSTFANQSSTALLLNSSMRTEFYVRL